jgi:hypothetical protein
MRLTNSEFIVTGNEKGPYNGDASNFFYCNLNHAEPVCVVDKPSSYYPSVTVVPGLRLLQGQPDSSEYEQ